MSVMIESKILLMGNTQNTHSDWLVETRHMQTSVELLGKYSRSSHLLKEKYLWIKIMWRKSINSFTSWID